MRHAARLPLLCLALAAAILLSAGCEDGPSRRSRRGRRRDDEDDRRSRRDDRGGRATDGRAAGRPANETFAVRHMPPDAIIVSYAGRIPLSQWEAIRNYFDQRLDSESDKRFRTIAEASGCRGIASYSRPGQYYAGYTTAQVIFGSLEALARAHVPDHRGTVQGIEYLGYNKEAFDFFTGQTGVLGVHYVAQPANKLFVISAAEDGVKAGIERALADSPATCDPDLAAVLDELARLPVFIAACGEAREMNVNAYFPSEAKAVGHGFDLSRQPRKYRAIFVCGSRDAANRVFLHVMGNLRRSQHRMGAKLTWDNDRTVRLEDTVTGQNIERYFEDPLRLKLYMEGREP